MYIFYMHMVEYDNMQWEITTGLYLAEAIYTITLIRDIGL